MFYDILNKTLKGCRMNIKEGRWYETKSHHLVKITKVATSNTDGYAVQGLVEFSATPLEWTLGGYYLQSRMPHPIDIKREVQVSDQEELQFIIKRLIITARPEHKQFHSEDEETIWVSTCPFCKRQTVGKHNDMLALTHSISCPVLQGKHKVITKEEN